MRRLKLWMLAAILCGGVNACQKKSASPPTPLPPAASQTSDTRTSVTKHHPDKQAATSVPKAPDAPPVAAVRQVLNGVEAGRLEVLADFLPESFQLEVAELVKSAAKKMPDDLWTQFRTLAEKWVAVLKKHSPAGSNDVPEERDFPAKLESALKTLTDDAVWDRSTWKSFELRTFLQGPGSAIFTAWQNLSSKRASVLSETKVRLLTMDGDQAKLEFQAPQEQEPYPVEFVHVEGKWIPKTLAEGWADTVGRGLVEVQQLDDAQIAEQMGRMRPMLLQMERTLDQMLESEKPEQVQLGWWQIQSLLIRIRQDWFGSGPPPQVAIRVGGELTDEELTDLLEQLVQAADTPEAAEYVTLPTTEGTVIQLSPVKDFETFLGRLTFASVKSQDAESRSVEIERRPKNE